MCFKIGSARWFWQLIHLKGTLITYRLAPLNTAGPIQVGYGQSSYRCNPSVPLEAKALLVKSQYRPGGAITAAHLAVFWAAMRMAFCPHWYCTAITRQKVVLGHVLHYLVAAKIRRSHWENGGRVNTGKALSSIQERTSIRFRGHDRLAVFGYTGFRQTALGFWASTISSYSSKIWLGSAAIGIVGYHLNGIVGRFQIATNRPIGDVVGFRFFVELSSLGCKVDTSLLLRCRALRYRS